MVVALVIFDGVKGSLVVNGVDSVVTGDEGVYEV